MYVIIVVECHNVAVLVFRHEFVKLETHMGKFNNVSIIARIAPPPLFQLATNMQSHGGLL